ncbi:MAG TPA: alpha/beta fold hydrolase [Candidatus Polarisedimenticolaceae bacterium]|nr:alpha/beta fold hydrolase [Candidatus Polarisedimenticolaceae bacterium]
MRLRRPAALALVMVAQPVAAPVETEIPVGGAALYVRTIGKGRPVIVLHGGPDFDHAYLLPELDRWRDAFRLVYYDQLGRGRSAENVRPEDVTLASDVEDLEKVRRHLGHAAPALLGHSWGALLALEYALRHPTHVSRLILMNPAPVSVGELAVMRKAYREQLGPDMDRQQQIVESPAYREGDPDAVTARYRIHFQRALRRRGDYERLIKRMHAGFVRQGEDGILKARAIEDRLLRDTWDMPGYDLLPELRELHVPTLVLVGDHDLIPVELAERLARAMPAARLVKIRDCGHFAYLERPGEVRRAVDAFFEGTAER